MMVKACTLLLGGLTAAILGVACCHPAIAGPREDMRGLWASGSCEYPTRLFFIEPPVFYMINDNGAYLSRMPFTSYEIDKYAVDLFRDNNGNVIVDYSWLTNDVLYTIAAAYPNETAVPQVPKGNAAPNLRIRCQSVPPSLSFIHGDGITLVQHLAPIASSCQLNGAQCARAIMGFVDVSKDGMLSKAELARAIRMLAYFIPLLAKPSTLVPLSEITGYTAGAMLFGPFIASSIIAGSDYNNDGQVTLEELFIDRDVSGLNAITEQVSLDILVRGIGAMLNLGSLVPSLLR